MEHRALQEHGQQYGGTSDCVALKEATTSPYKGKTYYEPIYITLYKMQINWQKANPWLPWGCGRVGWWVLEGGAEKNLLKWLICSLSWQFPGHLHQLKKKKKQNPTNSTLQMCNSMHVTLISTKLFKKGGVSPQKKWTGEPEETRRNRKCALLSEKKSVYILCDRKRPNSGDNKKIRDWGVEGD